MTGFLQVKHWPLSLPTLEYVLQPPPVDREMFSILWHCLGLVEALLEKGRADVEDVAGSRVDWLAKDFTLDGNARL